MNTLVCMTLCLHVLAVMGRPAMEKRAMGQPAMGQPAIGQPATVKPAIGQPATSLSNPLVTLQTLEAEVNALKKKDGSCENCRNSATVAFTAILDFPVVSIRPGHHIKFGNVVLNKGGAYNPSTGVFTAPVTGLYLFAATVLHRPEEKSFDAAIVHGVGYNDKKVAILHGAEKMWDEGSQTVIIQVNKGEQVWIRNDNTYNSLITGIGYSTFAGYLLG